MKNIIISTILAASTCFAMTGQANAAPDSHRYDAAQTQHQKQDAKKISKQEQAKKDAIAAKKKAAQKHKITQKKTVKHTLAQKKAAPHQPNKNTHNYKKDKDLEKDFFKHQS